MKPNTFHHHSGKMYLHRQEKIGEKQMLDINQHFLRERFCSTLRSRKNIFKWCVHMLLLYHKVSLRKDFTDVKKYCTGMLFDTWKNVFW